jgi:hypothetical protein
MWGEVSASHHHHRYIPPIHRILPLVPQTVSSPITNSASGRDIPQSTKPTVYQQPSIPSNTAPLHSSIFPKLSIGCDTGLLYKLRQALSLNYFLPLKSYLHKQHFHVKVGNDYSELTSIHARVPQGSVLGPLLYLLHTADLLTSPRTLIATFADDTSILTTNSDPAVASHLL